MDEVNQPAHYNTGNIECITAIEASMSQEEFCGYLKGNCLKYLWRYRYKGKPLEDLKKSSVVSQQTNKHSRGASKWDLKNGGQNATPRSG